ncbi:MAG: hypothetical protein ACR2J8_01900 [Thermomicrobiales bacterium]
MPITLFIGEGWNPFVHANDGFIDSEDEDETDIPTGADVAASAERARQRFLAILTEGVLKGIAVKVAPAAEGEGALWDHDFTEEEIDLVADALPGGCCSSTHALMMNHSDALSILRDAALEDESAWVVR